MAAAASWSRRQLPIRCGMAWPSRCSACCVTAGCRRSSEQNSRARPLRRLWAQQGGKGGGGWPVCCMPAGSAAASTQRRAVHLNTGSASASQHPHPSPTSPVLCRLRWIAAVPPPAAACTAAFSPARAGSAAAPGAQLLDCPTPAFCRQPRSRHGKAQAAPRPPCSPVSPPPTYVVAAASSKCAECTSCSSDRTAPQDSQAATPATTSNSTAASPHLGQASIARQQAVRRRQQAAAAAAAAPVGLAGAPRCDRPSL